MKTQITRSLFSLFACTLALAGGNLATVSASPETQTNRVGVPIPATDVTSLLWKTNLASPSAYDDGWSDWQGFPGEARVQFRARTQSSTIPGTIFVQVSFRNISSETINLDYGFHTQEAACVITSTKFGFAAGAEEGAGSYLPDGPTIYVVVNVRSAH